MQNIEKLSKNFVNSFIPLGITLEFITRDNLASQGSIQCKRTL